MAYFSGNTSQPIHIENVNCSGLESRLINCKTESASPSCDHSMDVGLICIAEATSKCIHAIYNAVNTIVGFMTVKIIVQWFALKAKSVLLVGPPWMKAVWNIALEANGEPSAMRLGMQMMLLWSAISWDSFLLVLQV